MNGSETLEYSVLSKMTHSSRLKKGLFRNFLYRIGLYFFSIETHVKISICHICRESDSGLRRRTGRCQDVLLVQFCEISFDILPENWCCGANFLPAQPFAPGYLKQQAWIRVATVTNSFFPVLWSGFSCLTGGHMAIPEKKSMLDPEDMVSYRPESILPFLGKFSNVCWPHSPRGFWITLRC